MYILENKNQPTPIEETTFADLNMLERDIEEMLRLNIDMLCETDEESMLIVGQQVRNEQNGRSDLTAIDNNGNIVLIEVKRDVNDIANRKEPFEFQAIRYAASCATLKSTSELVQNLFAPYVEKHRSEFTKEQNLTATEIATRKLDEFIKQCNITEFNEHQKIVLVASGFDEQTISAVAWLNSNKVDISCYQILPYRLNDEILIDIKKILPIVQYDELYVDIANPSKENLQKGKKTGITRRALPKIDKMLEWGIVNAGDTIVAKGTTEEALLQKDGKMLLSDGRAVSMQQWLKDVFGWSSVQTYAFAELKGSGKTLHQLREEYMSSQEQQTAETGVEE